MIDLVLQMCIGFLVFFLLCSMYLSLSSYVHSVCSASSSLCFPLTLKRILFLSCSNWHIDILMFKSRKSTIWIHFMTVSWNINPLSTTYTTDADSTPLWITLILFRACASIAFCFLLRFLSFNSHAVHYRFFFTCNRTQQKTRPWRSAVIQVR